MSFISCKRGDDLWTSYGKEITEQRQVGSFDKIIVGDKFDVVLIQDSFNAGKILMTAGENVIDGFTSKIVNNELQIAKETKFNWVRKLNVRQKVTIYFKEINQISIRASAKFISNDTINYKGTFRIDQSGLEDANFHINSDYLFLTCSNTGGLKLTGNCFLVSASVDDISFVDLINYNAKKCYLSSFSKADSYATASEVLDIRNFGDGSLFYKAPTGVELIIFNTGKGSVKSLD